MLSCQKSCPISRVCSVYSSKCCLKISNKCLYASGGSLSFSVWLLNFRCSFIESRIIKAIALLSDGGYSLSFEVLNVILPVESLVVPMVNGCVFSGL